MSSVPAAWQAYLTITQRQCVVDRDTQRLVSGLLDSVTKGAKLLGQPAIALPFAMELSRHLVGDTLADKLGFPRSTPRAMQVLALSGWLTTVWWLSQHCSCIRPWLRRRSRAFTARAIGGARKRFDPVTKRVITAMPHAAQGSSIGCTHGFSLREGADE